MVIYDICDNRRRSKLAKLFSSYGFRVQKSAFEAVISHVKYRKLLDDIGKYVGIDDNIRVYKIQGKGSVETFGSDFCIDDEDQDVIII